MQISRHWRLNPQRYRLQGVLYRGKEGSFVSFQSRPYTEKQIDEEIEARKIDAENKIIKLGKPDDSATKVILPKRKAV